MKYRVIEVPEPAVLLLDRFAERSERSFDHKKLSTDAVRLPDDLFPDSASIGVIVEKGASGLFTQLSRLFRSSDKKVVMISEWDYLADGGGVVQFSEYVNSVVRGTPAVLTVKRAGSKALWNMTWTTPQKKFDLYMYESVFDSETGQLLQNLAERISQ